MTNFKMIKEAPMIIMIANIYQKFIKHSNLIKIKYKINQMLKCQNNNNNSNKIKFKNNNKQNNNKIKNNNYYISSNYNNSNNQIFNLREKFLFKIFLTMTF